MTLAVFVESAGAAMGLARESFGSGGGTFAAGGGVGTVPSAPPGASGRAADGSEHESHRVHGHVTALGGHDTAGGEQLGGAVQAAGLGRGRMDSIIAQAVADVHALGMSTNTPQGQAALVTAIKRHLEDTKGTLDGAGADAGTRAAGASTTAAGYNGTAPAMSPAMLPQVAQMLGSAVPAAVGAPMSMLSGLPGMGGGLLSPFASLASMAQPGGSAGTGSALDAPSALLGGDNTVAAGAVRRALGQLGKPYVWGATGPGSFDCSGLVQYAYKGVGVDLPRETYGMVHVGRPVPPGQVQAGDLVFSNFSSPGVPEHVQLAIGGGKVVEAPTPGGHVQVSSMPGNVIVRRVV